MSRQYWEEALAWATADGASFNNTATETIIFPNVTIPGNYMQDGRCIRLIAYGRYSNIITSTPTITWAVRWGGVAGTIICQSPAIVTSASAVTSAGWNFMVKIQTRTNGTSGTLFGMGEIMMYTGIAPTVGTVTNYGVVASMNSTGLTVPAAATVDLTVDTALSVTGKFSAAGSSANAMTGHLYTIEALN